MRSGEEIWDQMVNMDLEKKYLGKAMAVQGQYLKNYLSCEANMNLRGGAFQEGARVKQQAVLLLIFDDNSHHLIKNVQQMYWQAIAKFYSQN